MEIGDRHTDRQTDRQTRTMLSRSDRQLHIDRQTDIQRDRQTDIERHTDRQPNRHRETDRYRETDRQTYRERDRPDKSSSNIVSCCCGAASAVNVSALVSVLPSGRRIIGGVAVTVLYLFLLPDTSLVLIPAFLAVFSSVRLAKPLQRAAPMVSSRTALINLVSIIGHKLLKNYRFAGPLRQWIIQTRRLLLTIIT